MVTSLQKSMLIAYLDQILDFNHANCIVELNDFRSLESRILERLIDTQNIKLVKVRTLGHKFILIELLDFNN